MKNLKIVVHKIDILKVVLKVVKIFCVTNLHGALRCLNELCDFILKRNPLLIYKNLIASLR